MTVAELIEKLQQQNPELIVQFMSYIDDVASYHDVVSVNVDENGDVIISDLMDNEIYLLFEGE